VLDKPERDREHSKYKVQEWVIFLHPAALAMQGR
jgi:hypothetical protein